jgi:hypothetical protein
MADPLSPIEQATNRFVDSLYDFFTKNDLDEEQALALENTFHLFESMMVLKYGLSVTTKVNGFEVASEIPVTGVSNPVEPEKNVLLEENNAKNMFQTESGLQTGALDTVCTVGKWNEMTLRNMWKTEDGQSAVRVIAMSQLPLAKKAKIVVDFYDGVVTE